MSAKIATALHEVMEKVSYVQKTGKNTFHNYKYAGEADLLSALRPAMIEAGLMLLPSVRSVTPVDDHGNVTVQMEYTLMHKDGDVWPEKIGAAGMGNDRAKNGTVGDKGVYKAITGANKYVLFKLFQIETGDDPEEASDLDKISHEPPPKSSAALKRAGSWEEVMTQFNQDMLDCKTLLGLESMKEAYRAKVQAEGWTAAWKAALKDEFDKVEDQIMRELEKEDA